MIAVSPKIKVEFATVLPRMFPITKPLWRRTAAEIEVVNSGREVLNATAKIPKRIIGIPKITASSSLDQTIAWALPTSKAIPMPKSASSVKSDRAVWWSVVALWYSRL